MSTFSAVRISCRPMTKYGQATKALVGLEGDGCREERSQALVLELDVILYHNRSSDVKTPDLNQAIVRYTAAQWRQMKAKTAKYIRSITSYTDAELFDTAVA